MLCHSLEASSRYPSRRVSPPRSPTCSGAVPLNPQHRLSKGRVNLREHHENSSGTEYWVSSFRRMAGAKPRFGGSRSLVSRKRVVLLFKALGPGGAEQLLVNAAKYLDRTEFDYSVAYLLPEFNALVGDLERQGLRVDCLGESRAACGCLVFERSFVKEDQGSSIPTRRMQLWGPG